MFTVIGRICENMNKKDKKKNWNGMAVKPAQGGTLQQKLFADGRLFAQDQEALHSSLLHPYTGWAAILLQDLRTVFGQGQV